MNPEFFVYILKSTLSDTYYVGNTNDLSRRLKEHEAGETKSLRGRGLYRLVYFEKVSNREEARLREKYLKSGSGREKRSALIANFPDELLNGFNV